MRVKIATLLILTVTLLAATAACRDGAEPLGELTCTDVANEITGTAKGPGPEILEVSSLEPVETTPTSLECQGQAKTQEGQRDISVHVFTGKNGESLVYRVELEDTPRGTGTPPPGTSETPGPGEAATVEGKDETAPTAGTTGRTATAPQNEGRTPTPERGTPERGTPAVQPHTPTVEPITPEPGTPAAQPHTTTVEPVTPSPTIQALSTEAPTVLPTLTIAPTKPGPEATPEAPHGPKDGDATPGQEPVVPEENQQEALLEQAALDWGQARQERDWNTLYRSHPAGFRQKCSQEEYRGYAPHLDIITGSPSIPENAEFILERVSLGQDTGTVHFHFNRGGREVSGSGGTMRMAWEDDGWVIQQHKSVLAMERPCDLANYWGHDFRLPHPAGSTMPGPDGTDITVTNVMNDAWQVVHAENEFNDPPGPGNRLYMVRLQVRNISGAGAIEVSDADFELVGTRRAVYKTYRNSCGVIPGRLEGEIFSGGTAEGNVCFRVGAEEADMVLIYNPGFSGNKRYLALE